MTPKKIIAEFNRMGVIQLSVMLHRLAKHVYTARLASGTKLSDATDFKAWLEELAEEAKQP